MTKTGIVAITVIMVEDTSIEEDAVARKINLPESGKETIPGKFSGDRLFCGQKRGYSDLLMVEVDEDVVFAVRDNEGWEILRSAAVAVHDRPAVDLTARHPGMAEQHGKRLLHK